MAGSDRSTGAVWTHEAIQRHPDEVGHKKDDTPSDHAWEVAGSVPVSESIKKQKGEWQDTRITARTFLMICSAMLSPTAQRSPPTSKCGEIGSAPSA